jgi:hypothetical protein
MPSNLFGQARSVSIFRPTFVSVRRTTRRPTESKGASSVLASTEHFCQWRDAQGRAPLFWKERVSASWGNYFSNQEKFIEASCQLEFLFNSYLGANTLSDAKLQKWLEANRRDMTYFYVPDLYAWDLRSTVPMAERCYDFVASNGHFPDDLSIDPKLPDQVFADKTREQRLLLYGGFLFHLKKWQADIMFHGMRRWPFMFSWEGRLGEIVKSYEEDAKRKGDSGTPTR